MLRSAVAASATAVCGLMINRGRFTLYAQSQQYSERVVRLVRESLVIDMLNQFKSYYLKSNAETLSLWHSKPGAFTEADARKYLDCGINVFALGHGAESYETGIRYFADWNGFIAGYSQWLLRIDSAAKLEQVKQSGKIGILLSWQVSDHFRNPDDVDTFFGLGQRVGQLTHNRGNLIGGGFFEARDGGLTDFGVAIVERMNKVGMGVDVSHCGDQTTLDVLELSKQPVLFTHAGCRTLAPKLARCKTDEMIRKMASKGGVMGIPFIRFLVRDREPVTIEHLLDHFDHVARLVGVEHVGIGSDFDLNTDDALPQERDKNVAHVAEADKRQRYHIHTGEGGQIGISGVNHPKRVYDLTEGLVRRKYSDADIQLILGGNFKRVLSAIWPV
jgi:membrane dipeptidase